MPTVYKTPGAYREEVPRLPPSIAQVETAIPVFIGYTEKAEEAGESLLGKAKQIESLADFELRYGGAPPARYKTYLNGNEQVVAVESSQPYYLHHALSLFFANGGGRCYIIAAAIYTVDGVVDADALVDALPVLAQEDEPTLIVAPDAALAEDDGLYEFQKLALAQCEKLGDRFVICDLKKSEDTTAFLATVKEFRDKIGISDLKYGAAYAPYVRSNIPIPVRFRDIELYSGTPLASSALQLESLTSDQELRQMIFDLRNASATVNRMQERLIPEKTGYLLDLERRSFDEHVAALFAAYDLASTDAGKRTALEGIYVFLQKIVLSVYTDMSTAPAIVPTAPNPASATQTAAFLLANHVPSAALSTGARDAFKSLWRHSVAHGEGGTPLLAAGTDATNARTILGIDTADFPPAADPDITALYEDTTTPAERNPIARAGAASLVSNFVQFWTAVLSAAATYEKTFDDGLTQAMGKYKQIKSGIIARASLMPPSGCVAGVYARVDGRRGVWKAPANESLNGVSGPAVQISAAQQESLNVDPVAGKSINAIRAFTGKGTLVWGARTLAGNDNEWRYVNVRRFFNMVEESAIRATEALVFEPNDRNTWVKAQGMLDNYLTVLWRQGALQGARPSDAFYVSVGLGTTMTALDVLEGRLIIEIGLAVVRPAEFIILRFSHKLAES